MPRRYILDSYALLAFLQDEPGAQNVEDIISADDTEIFVSVINLGEVFYILSRESGEQAALDFEAKLLDTPKIKVMECPWERAKAAARLKALGGLSFADCFGASLAQELEAVLVTGDPEFSHLENKGLLRVLWLPLKPKK
ncbi:MAG: type II toxin-antitoxin system VapC family toxin [Firmicutes bacterium]|nr:type II toxin-antitoxin system VapC family toxin [Bacillota bacterium]